VEIRERGEGETDSGDLLFSKGGDIVPERDKLLAHGLEKHEPDLNELGVLGHLLDNLKELAKSSGPLLPGDIGENLNHLVQDEDLEVPWPLLEDLQQEGLHISPFLRCSIVPRLENHLLRHTVGGVRVT